MEILSFVIEAVSVWRATFGKSLTWSERRKYLWQQFHHGFFWYVATLGRTSELCSVYWTTETI